MRPLISLLAIFGSAAVFLPAQSVYSQRPEDPTAVYLDDASFGTHADGIADDSPSLQRAINRVQETTHQGVVFIPVGRYRLAQTVHVWSGIRLVGYGSKRPVFVLGANTPGFSGEASRYMLWFTDERTPPGEPIADASEFTFWSAVTNVNFEFADGNPAAVAIRFNVAQHGFVSHCDFHLGSARAAIEAVGNQASDLHIRGGQFGIITGKTSPAWQFLLMDSTFTGQQNAAIRTEEAGFTLVRDQFEHVPVAIEIPDGEVEQLYARDLQMRDITRTAFKVGDTHNLRSEITLENIQCEHVAQFLSGAKSIDNGHSLAIRAAGTRFTEDRLSLGLQIGLDGREEGIQLQHHESRIRKLTELTSDVPALPAMNSWVNVHGLGVKGDGATDDTAALQRAIDGHPTLFLPGGMYRLAGTLHLRPNTVLIGFSPVTTQFVLLDNDSAFAGDGAPIPLLSAPPDGRTIVSGIGISTGNANPRAVGIEWRAGSRSLLDDICFFRLRSFYNKVLAPAAPQPKPPNERPAIQLNAQGPSLWVHDGGGGVLRDIWSHAGTAKVGLVIEQTQTPGVIYQFSCEHHMQKEVRIDHAAHWKIYDLQTEEEKPEGAEAVAVQLESSRDVLFANTYMYRVSRNVLPMPYAVVANASRDVRFDNVKVFSQTRLAFDHSIFDQGSGVALRQHDFTHFELTQNLRKGAPASVPKVFAQGTNLERVGSGFSNAAGMVADDRGRIFFTDAVLHRIYRYDPAAGKAPEVLATVEGSPMVLGFVSPGNLLAINYEKSVSLIDMETGAVSAVKETENALPNTTLLLPVGLHNELIQLRWMLAHRGYLYRRGSNTAKRSDLVPEHRGYFYAPGTTTAIMAGGTWRPLLQSAQLAPFRSGAENYITSEDDARTYLASFGGGETLTTKPFADRGGTSVVTDPAGNVYIASGQIYIYDRNGKQIGVLETPERPTSLCFGGKDHRTLFIGARSSLYAIRLAASN